MVSGWRCCLASLHQGFRVRVVSPFPVSSSPAFRFTPRRAGSLRRNTWTKMAKPQAIIAPSLLAGDWGRLADECNRMLALGADYLHMDIMDGHFVPNLTIGAPVIKSLRKHTKGFLDTSGLHLGWSFDFPAVSFLDCHLMVSNPVQWVQDYKEAGADMFTFHIEANGKGLGTVSSGDPSDTIAKIRAAGMKVGIALKPKTPVESVIPYVPLVDMVLIMTVEPGFGGQSFMADMMPKVRYLRERYPSLDIEVDGGLAADTIAAAAEAGANVIVAGSSVFRAPDPAAMIAQLRDAVVKAQ